MILLWLLVITAVGGFLAWLLSRWSNTACRWTSLIALGVDFVLLLLLWFKHYNEISLLGQAPWLTQLRWSWIPQLGIAFYLAADGLSLLLLLLTVFIGIIAVAASWSEMQERVGSFHFTLMLTLAGIIGVFMALDLFLFYFFWELMLVPMYFLISIWGHQRRTRAALKFFIFTQLSGLLMLIAILGLYFIHGHNTGIYTFNYLQLQGTAISKPIGILLMSGFFAAFAVKLPIVPVHVWQPDAYTEAPTAGSVILAGTMLKTAAYGFLRFLLPLFPNAARDFTPVAMVLAIIGILYGAILAFAQTDLKRFIAYSSISHMGFVLLGIFAMNQLAFQGAVVIMLAHGLSTGALFIMIGALQERMNTRDLGRLGGLWAIVPRMGGVGMFFALASLGLPGLANFVGEFLVLIGTYRASPTFSIIAALGFVTSVVYSLWLIQRTFYGATRDERRVPDLGVREVAVFAVIIAGIVWIGIYPQPVLNTAKPALEMIHRMTAQADRTDFSDSFIGPGTAEVTGAFR